MEIIIDGWRAGDEERKEAARVPVKDLPALTEEQKKVAKRMGISEEDYARSTYAGRQNQDRLIEKTKKFERLLQRKLEGRQGVELRRIRLDVLRHQYEVLASEGERQFSFFVKEDLIDDLFQSGSQGLEQNLERILDYALPARVA
ncbi:MAG TPA: hypothetical protein VJN89_09305 [Candidatus Acidoferrum sp.]|nr:hypothetical protein [Candidatus Acidoferrum sp.]